MLAAKQKAIEEVDQEAGVNISNPELYKTSVLGATVEWDLYIFTTETWSPSQNGQQLEQGESVEAAEWFGYYEVRSMIMDGQFSEDRVALILLRWLEGRA